MEIPEQVYQGCWVPPELAYDIERDVWARFEEDGTVTLGMTDIAQTKAGKLVSILFKAPGKVLRSGQSAATVESAKWVGPFPTPLSGEIVANNEATFARRHPHRQSRPLRRRLAGALAADRAGGRAGPTGAGPGGFRRYPRAHRPRQGEVLPLCRLRSSACSARSTRSIRARRCAPPAGSWPRLGQEDLHERRDGRLVAAAGAELELAPATKQEEKHGA